MPTEDDLLAAVDANPDDDAPRLAHADWVEKNGDPQRAEFIRLQVRGQAACDERERALLRANQARWLAGRPSPAGVEWRFVRGYPEELHFTSLTAFRRWWRVALAFPVRWVKFSGQRDLSALADCAGLARVRRLELDCYGKPEEEVLALLRTPRLGTLEGLRLTYTSLGAGLFRFLAGWGRMAGLRELYLDGRTHDGVLDAEAFVAFAWSPQLAGLRRLELSDCSLPPAGAGLLWAAPHLGGLEALSLADNPLGPEGLTGLGDGGRMPALRELRLGECRLGDGGAVALARATRWAGLRRLGLSGNLIGAEGVVALAGAAHLAGLERLDLAGNAVPDGGAEAIAGGRLSGLRALVLTSNQIGDAGLSALGRSRALPLLRELSAGRNTARPELIAAVERRFREGLPPLEEAPTAPAAVAEPAPPAATVGAADEDAQVRAILADPSYDLARAAYADWLEENGAVDHAELMRLPAEEHKRRDSLMKAIQGRAEKACPVEGVSVMEDKGLLEARMPMRAFLLKAFQQLGPAWLEAHRITRVRLMGDTKDWGKLGAAPLTARLRALNLWGCRVRDDGARALARAGLAGACSLGLRYTGLRDEGLAALGASAAFPRLVHLDLSENRVSADGLRALANGPLAGRLQNLRLSGNHVGDVGVGVLAQSAGLAGGLVSLALESAWITDQAVLALVASPHLGQLRRLDIGRNGITGDGLRTLAGSPLLRRLRRLALGKLNPGDLSTLELMRAAAAVPGLVVVVSKYRGEAHLAACREALGERLILE